MPSTAEELQQVTTRQRSSSRGNASRGSGGGQQSPKSPSSRRPSRRNENLVRYTKVHASDDEDEEAPLSSPQRTGANSDDTTPYNPDELPYPEEAEELTSNGNSLPNITHRPKVTFVDKCGAFLANNCSYDRFLCFFIAFIFLFAVFIAGIEYEEHHESPLSSGASNNNSPHPPAIPREPKPEDYTQRQIDLVIKMRELSGNIISAVGTPHHMAAHWILWIDESGITADSEFMWQRYVLALLYYQMGEDNHLLERGFELNPGSDECNWDKIGCNLEGHVQHIRFHNCGLSGNIPEEINALTELAYLDLSHNKFKGPIPIQAFKDLKKLQYVYLDSNDLEGDMPQSLCALREKKTLLNLTSDCNIDESKVHCTCCTNCGNTLPGLGPPAEQDVSEDRDKDDGNSINDAKESPHDDKSGYTREQRKIVQKLNYLSGEIIKNGDTVQHKATHWMIKVDEPMLDSRAKNLYQRYIVIMFWYMMESKTGDEKCFNIQPGVHECDWSSTKIVCNENRQVQSLHFEGCNLSGPIPTEIRELSEITSLNFRNNKLEGEIPVAVRHLQKLMYLYLDHNDLIGKVSPFICQMEQEYDLKTFTTDCINKSSKVDCSCCSNCKKVETVKKPKENGDVENQTHLNARQQAVGKKLFNLSGRIVRDGTSPQHRAAHWIMKDDAFSLNAEAENLYQRYVIALLYYMMGDQTAFLLDGSHHECRWNRISCDDNAKITYIKFDNLEIRGRIPKEIRVLSQLEYLDLSSNNLQGRIPDGLLIMKKLNRVFLEGNYLQGIIPHGLCDQNIQNFKVDCDKVICSCCDGCGTKSDSSPPKLPPPNLSSDSREDRIKERCLALLGSDTLVENSPENLAMKWITNHDLEQLDVDSPHFNQRLVIALIFYGLGPIGWTESFRVNPFDECSLHGVECNAKVIVSLDLSGQSMKGPIPCGIKHLEKLTSIDFSNNKLHGEIPEGLTTLPELETLHLQSNELTGKFPEAMCSVASSSFQVDCDKVSCSCCETCGPQVADPVSKENPIPSTRATEIKEKLMEISYQELDGESDPSSPRIKAQNWVINLDQMQLPATSDAMVHRYILAVLYYSLDGENWNPSVNDWLEGHMCQWSGVTCFMNREIISLTMSGFGLRGHIPYEIGELNGLVEIDLSSNSITGQVPAELGDLQFLEKLNLVSNSMVGNVPHDICKLRHEFGSLNKFIADCDPNHDIHVTCPIDCCTSCSN